MSSATTSLRVELPIERFTLRCGARLLVSRRPSAPVTALHMHLRGGHSLDAPGLEGTAYLTGALLDQGTKSRTEEEIAEELETHGTTLSGESNGVSGASPTSSWKLLLELFADLVMSPTFPKVEFRRQKQRLLDRLLLERDEPRVQCERLFKRLVYGDHWLGRPAYGTHASVARIERKHVREFHEAQWLGSRAIIAVCGEVDPNAVRALLDKRLAHWTRGEDLPYPKVELPPRGVRFDVFEAAREQVHVYLGHLGIRRDHPDYPALVVMDHVLGTGPGFTNRISRRLRDELGLAYTVHANVHGSAGMYPGTFTAYIGTSPVNVRTAIQGFQREIVRIQEEPVGAAELATAVDYVVGSFALSFQRAGRRASYMISAERYQLPPDNLVLLPQLFAAVTPADVQRVARTHLHPSTCCVAAAGPIKKSDLKAAMAELAS